MDTLPIQEDVRRYISRRVPSVPYLEAMLLLRENRQKTWPPEQVARRLYLGEAEALRLLAQLQADGIVAPQEGDAPGYRYAPESAELDELLERLAVAYSQHLVAISTLIHSKTSGKAQILAEAFVWRKDK